MVGMSGMRKRLLAIGVVGAFVAVGCGDDGEEPVSVPVEEPAAPAPVESESETDESESEPSEVVSETDESEPEAAQVVSSSVDEYCAVIDEVGDALPDDEQFDRLLAAAPDEIADSLGVIVEAIRADGEAAFSDPDVVANFPAVEAFEVENCGRDEGAASAEVNPDAERVDVIATDYAFEYLDPSAGAVSFVVANSGDEIHEMLLARFVGETTLQDALASEDPEAAGLVETVGFAGPVVPGAEIVLNVEDLTPGRYAVVCLIPSPDGLSHAEKGMVSEFSVG